MKKIISLFLVAVTLVLTGCFEVTQDLTINKDGSGTLSSTTDMSQMVTLAMQMAGDKFKDQKMNMDTTIPFKNVLDSIKDMSPANKELLKNGNVHVVMKMDDSKYLVNSTIPFKTIGDVEKINSAMQKEVSGKFLDNAMKEAMKQASKEDSSAMTGLGQHQSPQLSLPENYFILTCKNGVISRTADKTKLATLEQDEMLNQMKQIGAMGASLKTNFVINLPKPAKKIEGKNVKVSDDKKTITIANELNDLYDDPALFEFRVEY
ncbi:MAG: hypothetical protein ABUT20_47065 [Bacteroidota bacterium]